MHPNKLCCFALTVWFLAGTCETFLVTTPSPILRGSASHVCRGTSSSSSPPPIPRTQRYFLQTAAPPFPAGRSKGALSMAGNSLDISDDIWWNELAKPEAGAILVANETEVDHFFRQAVVLVLECGKKGSKGVILEMATAFNLGEMMPDDIAGTPFERNTLFRGGGGGSDATIMLHAQSSVQGCYPIGHGLYSGGMWNAILMIENGEATADQFKFIFNSCEWGPGALEREIMQGIWRVGTIPAELCVRQIGSMSDRPMTALQKRQTPDEPLWSLVRKQMKNTHQPRPQGLATGDVEALPERKPFVLNEMKKMIIGMAAERIYHFRNNRDAVSMVPLLDTGAEVFGIRGNDNIQAALERQWEGMQVKYELDPEKDISVADNGLVLVNFTLRTQENGGKWTQKEMSEEIQFSEYAMIRSMRTVTPEAVN